MARMHVCSEPGCPEVHVARRCPAHARQVEQARGSRHQRGYGSQHQQERKRWERTVQLGQVDCARCGQRIRLGQEWHLDHTDDRTGYLGPSHAGCNASAGGRAAHQ